MKAELGYYLDTDSGNIYPQPINSGEGRKIPIYGLRAVPTEICERQWGGSQFWETELAGRNL